MAANGGHLVVGAEQISDITGNAWLSELMPCVLTDARNLNGHAQLEQWLRGLWTSSRFQEPNLPNNINRGGAPGRYRHADDPVRARRGAGVARQPGRRRGV